VAAREPAPGGGAVAAVTVASAAGLVAMSARFAAQMPAADRLIARAEVLREEAADLADADAGAYGAVLDAYRRPRDAQRPAAIRAALEVAADVPLAIVERAHEVAEMGVRVLRDGNPNLRGDAVTAVLLADGAARSAAHLVELNVALGDLGPRRSDRAAAWCAELGGFAALAAEVGR
jgi:methenyltetrahydrofolate cyclohydrolase